MLVVLSAVTFVQHAVVTAALLLDFQGVRDTVAVDYRLLAVSGWLAVVVPAVLFGLRHLPLDLFEGYATVEGWLGRLLVLYGWAVLLGLVRWRTGSIAATVILHGVPWWLVIFGVLGTPAGARLGSIVVLVALLVHGGIGPARESGCIVRVSRRSPPPVENSTRTARYSAPTPVNDH